MTQTTILFFSSGYLDLCLTIVTTAHKIEDPIRNEITELYVLGSPVAPLASNHPKIGVLEVGISCQNEVRLSITEWLKQSQNAAASLTTFNDTDISCVMDMGKKYKDVKLGFMSVH